MKILSLIFLVSVLFACGAKEEEVAPVEIVKFANQKDKLSFAVGANQAGLLSESNDPNFASYDKEQLYAGFNDAVMNNVAFGEECKQSLTSLFGPYNQSFDKKYLKAGSKCLGVFGGTMFITGWEKQMPLAMLNMKMVLKGYKLGLSKQDTASLAKTEQMILVSNVLNDMMMKNNDDFMAKISAKPGLIKLPCGALVETEKAGTGALVKTGSTVTAHYILMNASGDTIQSSYDAVKQGQPIPEFSLLQVIPAWQEGIPTMKVGGEYRIYSPYQAAYGAQGQGNDIPPYSALQFYVKVVATK